MAIAMSSQRPRTINADGIVFQVTAEQQASEFTRARRRALHLQLHDLFLPTEASTEDEFGGKMNLPPERSESETGCSLTQPFVSYLDGRPLPEPEDAHRRRLLFAALSRLSRERPDLSLIVVEHSRTHTGLVKLAERWHVGSKHTTEGYATALDLMLGWLGE